MGCISLRCFLTIHCFLHLSWNELCISLDNNFTPALFLLFFCLSALAPVSDFFGKIFLRVTSLKTCQFLFFRKSFTFKHPVSIMDIFFVVVPYVVFCKGLRAALFLFPEFLRDSFNYFQLWLESSMKQIVTLFWRPS